MALWLCRAGRAGQHETKFIEDSAIYCTWGGLDWDMSAHSDRDTFKEKLQATYPDATAKRISHSTGQLWAFTHRMKIDDLVILPSKSKPIIYVGKILSEYKFLANAEPLYHHIRLVKWLKELPRKDIDQDLLFSLGVFMTICQITRNNAEQRIRRMLGMPVKEIVQEFLHHYEDLPREIREIIPLKRIWIIDKRDV